jgi:hypothetical protein
MIISSGDMSFIFTPPYPLFASLDRICRKYSELSRALDEPEQDFSWLTQ